MKPLKISDILSVLLCLSTIIFGAAVYDRLPDRIVTSWSMTSGPTGTNPKAFVVFGMPIIFAVVTLLCCIYTRWLERRERAGKLAPIVRLLFPLLFIVCEVTIYLSALGKLGDIRLVVCLLVSVIMILVGNYMPKIRKNWLVGIRTPHTLMSEEIWYRTHRFAGFTVTFGGIAGVVTTLLGLYIVTFVIIMAAVFVPAIYGEAVYYLGKREK
ncbi:MAG: SdpI family protein [Ruminococcus sp.]|nr:SdpI family protein [Ruminococcus sp.]